MIRADTNERALKKRVDKVRTCDDTTPTWQFLEYSQRFVTKACIDTVVPHDGKDKS